MINISLGATILMDMGHTGHNALIDKGATRSCNSETYYHTPRLLSMKTSF